MTGFELAVLDLAFTVDRHAAALQVFAAVGAVLLLVGAGGLLEAKLFAPRRRDAAPRPPCASCDGTYLDDPEFRAIGEATGVVSRG